MKYSNQFHKESTERCLKEMEEWAKNRSSQRGLEAAFEMHRKIKEAFPNEG